MKLVLGGGISGLAAAYYLRRRFPSGVIRVCESGNRVGGWIKSVRLDNGVIFEQAARTLRPRGPAGYNTLQLLHELGLAEKVMPIASSHPAARNRLVYAKGALHTLPSSIADLFKTVPPFSRSMLGYLLHELFAKGKVSATGDESIYEFAARRFGQDVADYAISPLICGICAGDAKHISVKFLMRSMFEYEQRYGSVLRGALYELWRNRRSSRSKEPAEPGPALAASALAEKWNLYSLDGGLQTLVEELARRVGERGVAVTTDARCDQLEFHEEHARARMASGAEHVAQHVLSCLPAAQLARLVQAQHPRLAAHLRQIPTVTVAVVNLYYETSLPLMDAFGFLVAPKENLPILGVIFDSCCFPPRVGTVLTVMMGGHWFEKHFGATPDHQCLLQVATKQLQAVLGVRAAPTAHSVNVLRDCIPQYTVGHDWRVAAVERYIQQHRLPLSVCGASYYGIGVNDVIYSTRLAVDNIP